MGKDLERDRGKARTNRSTLASSKAKAHRISPDIDGVRKRYEGSKSN